MSDKAIYTPPGVNNSTEDREAQEGSSNPSVQYVTKWLERFRSPTLRYVRLVDRMRHRSAPARRVLVVSGEAVYICTLSGDTKRAIPIGAVNEVVVNRRASGTDEEENDGEQEQRKPTAVARLLSTVTSTKNTRHVTARWDQVLLSIDGESDLLLSFVDDDRNHPDATTSKFVETLHQIATETHARSLPEARGTHLRSQANLKKMKKESTSLTTSQRLDGMVLLAAANPLPSHGPTQEERCDTEATLLRESIADSEDDLRRCCERIAALRDAVAVLTVQRSVLGRTAGIAQWADSVGGRGRTMTPNEKVLYSRLDAARQRNAQLRRDLRQEQCRLAEVEALREGHCSEHPSVDPDTRREYVSLLREREALAANRRRRNAERNALGCLVNVICAQSRARLEAEYNLRRQKEIGQADESVRSVRAELKELESYVTTRYDDSEDATSNDDAELKMLLRERAWLQMTGTASSSRSCVDGAVSATRWNDFIDPKISIGKAKSRCHVPREDAALGRVRELLRDVL